MNTLFSARGRFCGTLDSKTTRNPPRRAFFSPPELANERAELLTFLAVLSVSTTAFPRLPLLDLTREIKLPRHSGESFGDLFGEGAAMLRGGSSF